MAIRKHEFYEGAALHQLARSGGLTDIRYESPFFLVNGLAVVYLKYSTKGRTPWGFSFTPEEQTLLEQRAEKISLVIGLICGADGIAAISYGSYRVIATRRATTIHVSCARKHGQHYAIGGPDGELPQKISPSLWQRLLVK